MENRYGDKYWFEKVSEKVYLLEGELDYFRVGLLPNGSYSFIDPSGGPYISVGQPLEGSTIKRIFPSSDNKFYIEVE